MTKKEDRLKDKIARYCYDECPIASKRDNFYMDCGKESCEFYPFSPWADKPKPPHPDQIPMFREISPDLELIIFPERRK